MHDLRKKEMLKQLVDDYLTLADLFFVCTDMKSDNVRRCKAK